MSRISYMKPLFASGHLHIVRELTFYQSQYEIFGWHPWAEHASEYRRCRGDTLGSLEPARMLVIVKRFRMIFPVAPVVRTAGECRIDSSPTVCSLSEGKIESEYVDTPHTSMRHVMHATRLAACFARQAQQLSTRHTYPPSLTAILFTNRCEAASLSFGSGGWTTPRLAS